MRAVSASRISPTMITSGSWRSTWRRPLAKVMPLRVLTWLWLIGTPSEDSSYSIGSSMVMTLRSTASSERSVAYSVVVLPEPVGPVTRMMPLARRAAPRKPSPMCAGMPRLSMAKSCLLVSSRRSTARSP